MGHKKVQRRKNSERTIPLITPWFTSREPEGWKHQSAPIERTLDNVSAHSKILKTRDTAHTFRDIRSVVGCTLKRTNGPPAVFKSGGLSLTEISSVPLCHESSIIDDESMDKTRLTSLMWECPTRPKVDMIVRNEKSVEDISLCQTRAAGFHWRRYQNIRWSWQEANSMQHPVPDQDEGRNNWEDELEG